MADPDAKISVHSLADLKNTSDDAIPTYLNSLHFTQSHTLTDIRLALGYSAFLLCAACFYWDYTLGFDATKTYTAIAVALYTLLNGLLTAWIYFVERGVIYSGTSPSGDKITIATSITKHTPIYTLLLTTHPASPPHIPTTLTLARPFSAWFDSAGHLVAAPLQSLLASEVAVIGAAAVRKAALEVTVEEAEGAVGGSVAGGRARRRKV